MACFLIRNVKSQSFRSFRISPKPATMLLVQTWMFQSKKKGLISTWILIRIFVDISRSSSNALIFIMKLLSLHPLGYQIFFSVREHGGLLKLQVLED